VSLFQHPVLLLVFKQNLLLSHQFVGSGDSFVNGYVPYFRQRLICHLLLAIYFCRLYLLKKQFLAPSSLFSWRGLPAAYFCRLCLLKVLMESSSLPSPLLQYNQNTPPPLLHILFSSLFIIQFFCFFAGQGPVCPGGYAGLSQGWLWEHCKLLICSLFVLCLPSTFGASVWWHRSPLGFSVNVEWRGFVLSRGLGCWCLASSWWFCSCHVWLLCLSKIFDLWSSCYLLPPSSHYLGSYYCQFHFNCFFFTHKSQILCPSLIQFFVHLSLSFIQPLGLAAHNIASKNPFNIEQFSYNGQRNAWIWHLFNS
jgi:hypothetical protein